MIGRGGGRSGPWRGGKPGPGSAAGSKSAPGVPGNLENVRREGVALDPDKILPRQPWTLLRTVLPGAETEQSAKISLLRAYAKLLLEWNRGVSNLISRNDETRLVERHLFESLAPAKRLIESGCTRFVDFGSGAGLPAIPLALIGVGKSWTTVESRRNKTLFMRRVKQDMALGDFEVLTGRLEVLIEESPEALACDAFTSRATMVLGPTLAMAARIVTPGGYAFLWKGSSHEKERDESRALWADAWEFVAADPIGSGPNVVSVFKRKA